MSPIPGRPGKRSARGDFNGDGFSDDILFQNTSTAKSRIWEMNGQQAHRAADPVSANPGPSWHAIGTDGGSDILFQNTSGQASIWESEQLIAAGSPIPAELASGRP